jgi:hypothetical protein
MSFTSERTSLSSFDSQTITVTNTGSIASGPVDTTAATDLSALEDPLNSAMWMVGGDDCEGKSLAPGASCHILLGFSGSVSANRSWTGDFVAQANPGGVTHVAVAAHITSALLYDDVTELDATPTVDGTTHLVITNATSSDIGPLDAALSPPGTVGTFSLSTDSGYAVPACSQHMTLAAGAACQWVVSYHNTTGAGFDNTALHLDAGDVHAAPIFTGFGKP